MSRVTSKLQVTIPKAIAEHYGIEPGQEIEWLAVGEAIRVVRANAGSGTPARALRPSHRAPAPTPGWEIT